MFLFSILLCLLTTLNTFQSYVLIAGNMQDFRSIAQQYSAKRIAAGDTDAVSVIKYRQERDDIDDQEEDSMDSTDYTGESQQQSFEISTQSYYTQTDILSETRKPPKKIRTVMSLDEVVEKVKQRLQDEMLTSQLQMPALQKNKPQQQQQQLSQQQQGVYNQNGPVMKQYENPESAKEQATEHQEADYEDKNTPPPHPNYKKKKENRTPSKNRFIESVNLHREIQEPDDIQTNKPQTVEKIRPPAQNVKKVRQQFRKPNRQRKPKKSTPTIAESETPDQGDLFKSVDMLKNHDSYDEYVIPPKDNIFASEEGEVSKFRNNAGEKSRSTPLRPTADEVTTFSPKRLTAKHKPVRTATTSTIAADGQLTQKMPLNDQNENGDVYEENETEGTTEEPKARTEVMSMEKSEETHADPNDPTTTEATVKGKGTTRPLGTSIPKRDFYKLSSPNYYAKLPVVAEKYNFDEPIPEKDREPEALKSIGNPPASINGKIMLL